MALVVAAIVAVVLTWHPTGSAVVLSVLGASAVTRAAFNGTSFLSYGHDVSPMNMSALWASSWPATPPACSSWAAANQPIASRFFALRACGAAAHG
jgi:hypothetical protein